MQYLSTKNSKHIAQALKLADKNVKTLGLFPAAAFREKGENGCIIGAIDNNDDLVGYILFRKVKTKFNISIVHLCINNKDRGKKIAKKLLDYLVENSAGAYDKYLSFEDFNDKELYKLINLK
jgi:ribosomal protein S18 acetylase RimI-like enzyme